MRRSARPSRALIRWASLAVAVALIAAAAAITLGGTDTKTAVAYFASTTGLYEGNEVRILGVPIGEIDQIDAQGDRVRVQFHYDADLRVPADATAAIVAPTLVSSRYIQLAPRYTGGPVLPDGATIPLQRTVVPVEWDEIKAQLSRVTRALGPQGTDRHGSLSRALDTAASVFKGQGRSFHTTLQQLSRAMETLSRGRGDLFGTIRNLQVFVSALATSDQQIVEFNHRLAAVSELLANNRQELGTALADLAVAVRTVEEFVRTNRDELRTTVADLAEVTGVVARQQADLAQTLHVAPTALANLYQAYNPATNSVPLIASLTNFANPTQFICSSIAAVSNLNVQQARATCSQYLGPLLDLLAVNYPPVAADPVQRPGPQPVPATPGERGEQAQNPTPPGEGLVPDLDGLLLPGGQK